MNAFPDRRIGLSSAPNMRDLGGLPVADGVVRTQRVFRSASLAQLSDDDQRGFEGLGIRTVYDLRTAGERASAPDRLPAQIPSIGLDVLADSPMAAAADINGILADPTKLAELLQSGRAEQLLEDSYRDIVRLPSALASYRDFYLGLADRDRSGAVLFHCTTGKDRTGWAAASLLMLLGADEATVRADYLQTNTDLLPALQPMLDGAAEKGVPAEALMPVLGVRDSYLDAALEEVEAGFGGIDGYFRTGLGLDDAVVSGLRERLVA